jgi:hypothetical protein
MDCAAGGVCVQASMTSSVSLCDKFCTADTDCVAPGGLCLLQLSDGSGGSIPNVKLCTANCSPITNVGCSVPGTSCQLLQESTGAMRLLTDCRGAGSKTHLATCDPMLDDCAPKFGCFNIGTQTSPQYACLQYCNYGSPACPSGQSCLDLGVSLGGTEFGACY